MFHRLLQLGRVFHYHMIPVMILVRETYNLILFNERRESVMLHKLNRNLGSLDLLKEPKEGNLRCSLIFL